MSTDDMIARPSLEAFERAHRAANEAFNHHDFEAAFRGLLDDFEWHTVADVPGPKTIRGRRGVIEAFQGLLVEFPDWHVELQEFIDAGSAILVRSVATATGRGSGVSIRQPFTQVWTFRDGRPVGVHEYFDHREALEAAGLEA